VGHPSFETAAILLNRADNVGTALREIPQGTVVSVRVPSVQGLEDGKVEVFIRERIPVGHKFALRRIKRGEPVVKYGYAIGLATADIEEGAHVHVHNLESTRGRGDK